MKRILWFVLPFLLGYCFIKPNNAQLNHQTLTNNPYLLYTQSIQYSIHEISKASRIFHVDPPVTGSLSRCHKCLSMAAEDLATSLPASPNSLLERKTRANYKAWLSAAVMEVRTCFDALPEYTKKIVAPHFDHVIKPINTGLSILSRIGGAYKGLEEEALSREDDNGNDNKLNEKADVVVAKDGSGNYKMINEAIKAVPSSSNKRFVIHVKKGVYTEQVVVPGDKWNVMMYGDGMSATIVQSSHGTTDPHHTPDTATFTVWGKGFIAKNIAFKNTAGASAGVAVAVFSASDQSVFYRCLIDGYQDTLWAYSNRQFYCECEIRGTIDFIFGGAAFVIQNSVIGVKKPGRGQYNVITAQGKEQPNAQSGLAIQNCDVRAMDDLSGIKTFLGRPWKPYSTVAFIKNKIGGFIDPNGWTSMGGKFPSTVTFVEYDNSGPGGSIKKWSHAVDSNSASKFTVKSLINGDQWIPATGVPFTAGL